MGQSPKACPPSKKKTGPEALEIPAPLCITILLNYCKKYNSQNEFFRFLTHMSPYCPKGSFYFYANCTNGFRHFPILSKELRISHSLQNSQFLKWRRFFGIIWHLAANSHFLQRAEEDVGSPGPGMRIPRSPLPCPGACRKKQKSLVNFDKGFLEKT